MHNLCIFLQVERAFDECRLFGVVGVVIGAAAQSFLNLGNLGGVEILLGGHDKGGGRLAIGRYCNSPVAELQLINAGLGMLKLRRVALLPAVTCSVAFRVHIDQVFTLQGILLLPGHGVSRHLGRGRPQRL